MLKLETRLLWKMLAHFGRNPFEWNFLEPHLIWQEDADLRPTFWHVYYSFPLLFNHYLRRVLHQKVKPLLKATLAASFRVSYLFRSLSWLRSACGSTWSLLDSFSLSSPKSANSAFESRLVFTNEHCQIGSAGFQGHTSRNHSKFLAFSEKNFKIQSVKVAVQQRN